LAFLIDFFSTYKKKPSDLYVVFEKYVLWVFHFLLYGTLAS